MERWREALLWIFCIARLGTEVDPLRILNEVIAIAPDRTRRQTNTDIRRLGLHDVAFCKRWMLIKLMVASLDGHLGSFPRPGQKRDR